MFYVFYNLLAEIDQTFYVRSDKIRGIYSKENLYYTTHCYSSLQENYL